MRAQSRRVALAVQCCSDDAVPDAMREVIISMAKRGYGAVERRDQGLEAVRLECSMIAI